MTDAPETDASFLAPVSGAGVWSVCHEHKARIDNRKRKLVKQQYVLHMSPQYSELRPTSGWDRLTSLGYPCIFQLVLRLGSFTARHLVVGISQTLRRWTEGATYIRQGDHHVGQWPTFLVFLCLPFLFPFSLLFFLLTLTYLIPSRIWTRSISRPEVVGGDRTWV